MKNAKLFLVVFCLLSCGAMRVPTVVSYLEDKGYAGAPVSEEQDLIAREFQRRCGARAISAEHLFPAVNNMYTQSKTAAETAAMAYADQKNACLIGVRWARKDHDEKIVKHEECVAAQEKLLRARHTPEDDIAALVAAKCSPKVLPYVEPWCVKAFAAQDLACATCPHTQQKQKDFETCAYNLQREALERKCTPIDGYDLFDHCGKAPIIRVEDFAIPSKAP